MPNATTKEEAASDLACQALATNILDFTLFAIFSIYLNKNSLANKVIRATHKAIMCTGAIADGFNNLFPALQSMPIPTANKSPPNIKVAAVSYR